MVKPSSTHRLSLAVVVLVVAIVIMSVAFSRNTFSGDCSDLINGPTLKESIVQPREQQNKTSKDATVMGMAINYHVGHFRRFVGSLRRSGFLGHIILAISPNPQPGVVEYLTKRNVIMKRLKLVNCSTDIMNMGDSKKPRSEMDEHELELITCADPYPNLKARWGRYALLRDYLVECKTCTGPVLVADFRDTVFQRDPFGPDAPPVDGLQLFEEHRTMRTTHWLVQHPVEHCKGIPIVDKPMLCSGTTIGTRDAMLHYLSDMVNEMNIWMQDPKCCCIQMNGDDQAIHNYLYYTGIMPYATAQKNRVGLVNTVGAQGSMIFEANRNRNMLHLKMSERQASMKPYTSLEDEAEGLWLGLEHDLTDAQGFFIDFNGERSFIVHQYDRFGPPVEDWLNKKSGLEDA